MGGSGGGGPTFYEQSPSELSDQIRKAELSAADAEFGPKLAEHLNKVLSLVNDRDVAITSKRLDVIKECLGDALDDSFDLRFGGSVAKHTYVDGLSDVDAMLVLRSNNGNANPDDLLDQMAQKLANVFGEEGEVSRGTMAVTVKFSDADELQLIPAMKEGDRVYVPSWKNNEWSKIDPVGFRDALVKWNDKCNGKLVPTIKLAKSINATLPESSRLSGYHIEALSIQSFKKYDGAYVVEKMLPHLFRSMSELVKAPIKDSTGQSVHVDEYLGAANSQMRRQQSHVLDRIARRMENATASKSIEQWDALLRN